MSSSSAGRKCRRATSTTSGRLVSGTTSRIEKPGRQGRSTLTCVNCRTRKTKCCGTQPQCMTCQVYQEVCRYEKPPPMSQILAMAKKLQEYEQIIQAMRNHESSPAANNLSTTLVGEASTTAFVQAQDADSAIPMMHQTPEVAPTQAAEAHPREAPISDLSIDENGKVCRSNFYSIRSLPLSVVLSWTDFGSA